MRPAWPPSTRCGTRRNRCRPRPRSPAQGCGWSGSTAAAVPRAPKPADRGPLPMGPDPAVAQVRLAVRKALATLAAPAGGVSRPLVLVACSGGQDSLALAAATAAEAPRAGLSAGGVTVDHRLQPGSDTQAARVAHTLAGLGLDPVLTETVSADGPGGPEAAARAARYAALDGAAGRLGAVAVLLGHTLDDQAETVLLGLARGSGARSLAGMAPVSGRYLRP